MAMIRLNQFMCDKREVETNEHKLSKLRDSQLVTIRVTGEWAAQLKYAYHMSLMGYLKP